jgi:hypothetical protein
VSRSLGSMRCTVIALLLLLFAGCSSGDSTRQGSWPSFSLTYRVIERVVRRDDGTHSVSLQQSVRRLDYVRENEWQVVVLDSSNPADVGSRVEAKDGRLSRLDADGDIDERPIEGVAAPPGDWFIPMADSVTLERMGWQRTSSGTLRMSRRVTKSCTADLLDVYCAGRAGAVEVDISAERNAAGIPIHYAETAGGTPIVVMESVSGPQNVEP